MIHQLEMQDLNGDSVPEILALSKTGLLVYRKNGSDYIENRLSYSETHRGTMLIEDIDGDQVPEIVISRTKEYSSVTSDIIVLDPSLKIKSSFSVDGTVTAMASNEKKDNTFLIALSGPQYATGTEVYIKRIDAQIGSTLWSSPPLLGEVTGDSMRLVQKPGSTKKQLAIGTHDAMYITQ